MSSTISGMPGQLEVGEGAVSLGAEAAGALQRHETGGERVGDRARVVGHVLADVVQPLAVSLEVVGEDARALERLDQLELELALPGEGMPERELDLLAVVAHLLQRGGSSRYPVHGPMPSSPVHRSHSLVEIADDERALLEGRRPGSG